MGHRVEYKPFAGYLASHVPWVGDCGDLSRALEVYFSSDPEMGARMVRAVGALPTDREWLQGAVRVADVLRADNPRFLPGMWLDWVTEDR